MLKQILGAVLPHTGDIIDRFIPNKSEAAKAKSELEKSIVESMNKANLSQIEVNKVEAGHRSLFVAGWRPFVGWVCGVAMAWHFVLAPLLLFFSAWFGFTVPEIPSFDMDTLMTVLMGLLGLGGLRTYEKFKGISR